MSSVPEVGNGHQSSAKQLLRDEYIRRPNQACGSVFIEKFIFKRKIKLLHECSVYERRRFLYCLSTLAASTSLKYAISSTYFQSLSFIHTASNMFHTDPRFLYTIRQLTARECGSVFIEKFIFKKLKNLLHICSVYGRLAAALILASAWIAAALSGRMRSGGLLGSARIISGSSRTEWRLGSGTGLLPS